MDTIGEILKNDEPPAEQIAEPVAIVDPPSEIADPPSDRLRDDKGRFASKETGVETSAAEPAAVPVPPTEQASQLPQEEYVALRAVRDENKELRQRLQALERSQPQFVPPQPIPEFWDDPDTHLARRDERLVDSVVQRLQHEQRVEKLDLSEAAAQAKYPDYQEKFAAFEQAVQLNPRLAREMAVASDPGEFVYSRGKTALEIQRHGSIDALLAAERQKWETEARANFQPAATFPSTTAADGSVGGRAGPEWGGPQPLKSILGR